LSTAASIISYAGIPRWAPVHDPKEVPCAAQTDTTRQQNEQTRLVVHEKGARYVQQDNYTKH
jgi:hypothetical protein